MSQEKQDEVFYFEMHFKCFMLNEVENAFTLYYGFLILLLIVHLLRNSSHESHSCHSTDGRGQNSEQAGVMKGSN